MTVNGAEVLSQELKKLKEIERPRIVEAIAEARAHGDLKENAEYHAAKEEQGFIEARIKEIESKLSTAQIIDVSKLKQDGRVVFGTKVELLNLNTEEEIIYQIVGEDEADVMNYKISCTSPIAQGLLGKEEGDEVNIQTPNGIVPYEILEVHYTI
ncbi:Transcription elongation factor GreA [hydrothermal vent metagenome]|uniref:Transcription elongation factor GreA n=1 Tax=hydrothermal vent metagenome TaxID=652676 RepID=A0A1W1CG01_9ZZZZ